MKSITRLAAKTPLAKAARQVGDMPTSTSPAPPATNAAQWCKTPRKVGFTGIAERSIDMRAGISGIAPRGQ